MKKRDELLADVHQRIAANARYYRLRRGISQREAAAGLGIADTTIRNIEHGKKPVSTLLLARLAAFYALENVDALLAARELITLRRGAFSVKYSLPIGERT